MAVGTLSEAAPGVWGALTPIPQGLQKTLCVRTIPCRVMDNRLRVLRAVGGSLPNSASNPSGKALLDGPAGALWRGIQSFRPLRAYRLILRS